ncbi:MAG: hypothetical protein JWM53_3778 [bacterium]|nr:hypothetical protein [bacterium]
MGWMQRNMLQPQDIRGRDGLARRLLRSGTRIVSNSALYGMVIYCVGCVIPTPLDRAPAPTNYGPVFVTMQVNPPFGPVTESIAGALPLSLAATDPNHDDVLTVRLFEPDSTAPTGFIDINQSVTLTNAPTTDDPDLRVGSFEPVLCLRAQPGDRFDVYAVVADRPFTNKTMRADGGLTDQNHWELTCM